MCTASSYYENNDYNGEVCSVNSYFGALTGRSICSVNS
jgi:hypothetical protein